MKDHIPTIEAHLKELERLVDAFGSDEDIQDMLRRIHQPGWTTPAEAQLVLGLIDATTACVKQATQLRHTLLNGVKAVGTTRTTVGVN